MTPDTVVDDAAGSDTNWKCADGELADHAIWALQSWNVPVKPVVGLVALGRWVGGPFAAQVTTKETVDGIGGNGGFWSPIELTILP